VTNRLRSVGNVRAVRYCSGSVEPQDTANARCMKEPGRLADGVIVHRSEVNRLRVYASAHIRGCRSETGGEAQLSACWR